MSFWWLLIASLMLGLASAPVLVALRDRFSFGNWLAPGALAAAVLAGALVGWTSRWLDAESIGWASFRLALGVALVGYGVLASRLQGGTLQQRSGEKGKSVLAKAGLWAIALAPCAVMLAFAADSGDAAHGALSAVAFALGAAFLGAFHAIRRHPARTATAAGGLAFVVAFSVSLQSLHAAVGALGPAPVYAGDPAIEVPEPPGQEDAEALVRYPLPNQSQLEEALPGAKRFVLRIDPAPYYEGYAEGDTRQEALVGYAFVCQHFVAEEYLDATRGYGSFLPVLLGVGADGKTAGLVVLENRETAAYLKYTTTPERLERYLGRPLSAPFEPGEDVDAVSGATFTGRALAAAVRYGARGFEEAVLQERGTPVEAEREEAARAVPGWRDVLFLGVLAVGAFVVLLFRSTVLETALLIVSVVLLGGLLGRFFSLDDALRVASADLPRFAVATGWWITVAAALVATVLLGRVFCRFFCPFGALAELLWRGARVRRRVPRRWDRLGRRAPAALIWLAGLWYAATGILPAGRIEPFAATFSAVTSLEAALSLASDDFLLLGVVIVALVGSALNRRFWCLYLCPAGAALRVLSRLRLSNGGVPPRCAGCPSDPGEEILCPGCMKTRPRSEPPRMDSRAF